MFKKKLMQEKPQRLSMSDLNIAYNTLVVMSQDSDINPGTLKSTKNKLLDEMKKELDINGLLRQN